MIVNFRAHDISRGARKLNRTPTLIKKKQLFLVKNFTICKIYWNTLSIMYLIKGKERPMNCLVITFCSFTLLLE
jgi:hypothetical protein